MQFIVLPVGQAIPANVPTACYLLMDDWNDWWEYRTLFSLYYVDAQLDRKHLGAVKIAKFGMVSDRPDLRAEFDRLDPDSFSLGQDENYYEAIRDLGPVLRDDILRSLNDLAIDPDLRERALRERVTTSSLMRDVTLTTIEGQFARIARGGARLTPYAFTFTRQATINKGPITVDFNVVPESRPSTNVHVLIGRNGAGKSTLLNDIGSAFSAPEAAADLDIANVVHVSFSAFDEYLPIIKTQSDINVAAKNRRTFHYIGLKRAVDDPFGPTELKNSEDLSNEMLASAESCMTGTKRERLLRALELLSSDPIFDEVDMKSVIFDQRSLRQTFSRLSSGHKIVLLTTTRLVETVEEKSLILLDEPEAHLHPPLLSALIRALSDLLIDRNGLAIVATHSPVVLQEVPRDCVWRISRAGNESSTARPERETFAENAGTLTYEIFGLEVENTGFNRMLSDVALEYRDYADALNAFKGQLGVEGRALLRARLIAAKQLRVDS